MEAKDSQPKQKNKYDGKIGGIQSEPKAIQNYKFRYKTDMDRDVLIKNYEKRGWTRHHEKE